MALRPGDDLDRIIGERGGVSVDLDEQRRVRLGGASQFAVGEDALAAAFLRGGDRLDVEELEHRRIHTQREQVDGGIERGFIGTERQQEGAPGGG